MKKILFLLLLTTGFLQAQTYPVNPTPFGKITLNTNIESTTATKISVQEDNKQVNWQRPENISINQPPHPINYTAPTATLGGHLIGIDTRLGQIGQTTAGQTNRIYFTGDNTTVNSIVYFASNATGKGLTPSASPPNLVNGDDTKQYFTKDIIGIAQPANTISAPGIYSGQLSVMVDSDIAQERYTIEVYKTDNLGVPIASGITGAPVGDLGVTVITILDSGILDLSASAVTNITVSGVLTEQLTLNAGERVRYHVSAAKVGTAGSNVTFTVYYGSNYSSYYDVPVTTTTDGVVNKSTVTGLTTSDALDHLNTTKAENIDIAYLDVKRFGATGDGITDDYTAIQSGITYCIANKKGLVFTSGTYKLSAVLLVASPLNIKGEGSPTIQAVDGVSIFNISADNVIISGIKTKSNYVDDVPHIILTGKNAIIQNNTFTGQGWTAVDVGSTATNTTIQNNYIDNFEFGIYGRSTVGLKVLNNTFTGGFDKEGETLGRVGDGVKLSSPQDDTSPGNNWTIITGNRFTDMYRDGIDMFTGGQNVIISNNIFERLGVLGLDIKTIYRDTFTLGTSVPGIRQSRKIIVSNNVFKDTGYNNLVSGYSWISVIGTDETAGQTHGLADNPNHIIIESNLFEDATIYGILLDRVSNIDIKNNRIKGMSNTSHHSIFLQGVCTNLNIDSNSFYDLNNAALRSTLTTHSNIRFTNNSVKGLVSNTQTTVFIGGSNIDISGNDIQYGNNLIFSSLLTNSNVSNNKLRNATGMGIDVRTSSTNVTVNGNSIYDSVTGIRGSAAMINCTVANNACYAVTTPYLNFSTFTSGNIYGNTIENVRSLDVYGGLKMIDETASTIASFDASKNLKSLSTSTYPSLTELAYVKGLTGNAQTQINSKADIASPVFTGNPTAPTATAGDNDTSIATTAFVNGLATSASYSPTLTTVGNIDALSLLNASYTKIGNIVSVSATISIDATTINNLTQLTISLPFNRANSTDLHIGSGSTYSASVSSISGVHLFSDATNTVRLVTYAPIAVSAFIATVKFQYSTLN